MVGRFWNETLREDARQLMEILIKCGRFSWNDKHIAYIDGKKTTSEVFELVQYTIAESRARYLPDAIDEFIVLLADIVVPKRLIKHPRQLARYTESRSV